MGEPQGGDKCACSRQELASAHARFNAAQQTTVRSQRMSEARRVPEVFIWTDGRAGLSPDAVITEMR